MRDAALELPRKWCSILYFKF